MRRVGECLWILGYQAMSRAIDREQLRSSKCPHGLDGRLATENRGRDATQYERWTAHFGNHLPQFVGRLRSLIENPAVRLQLEPAIGPGAERSKRKALKHFTAKKHPSLLEPGDIISDSWIHPVAIPEVGADPRNSVLPELRAGVDEDKGKDLCGPSRGNPQSDAPAERVPHDGDALQAQFVDQEMDIPCVAIGIVLPRRIPVGISVSTQIDHDRLVLRNDSWGKVVPDVATFTKSMKKDAGWPIGAPTMYLKPASIVADDLR